MNEIEIVALTEELCKSVVRLSEKNLPEHITEKMLHDFLRYDYNKFFVAYDKKWDRVCGFAGVMLAADEGELLYIATDLPYRNHGIGNMLLSEILNLMKYKKASRLLLEVRESNKAARCFYLKHDFTVLSIRENYYHNPVENAVVMEKIIN
ncbi:MAG: ribosomal protein S18-alanine N-acetyltransferase [Lachnospiraceae bacterium]